MITYRHHVVSLVAVFLALAVGVVLGGGPLAERTLEATDDTPSTSASEERALEQAAYGDAFAEAAAQRLVGNRLDGRTVAVVTTPGVDEGLVTAVTADVTDRGGEVTARFDLLETLVDGGSTSLVDTLGTQLVTELDAGTVDRGASSYVRLGQLLGLAVGTTNAGGVAADLDTSTIRDSLAGADLATSSDDEADRAGLVLVLLGDDTDPDVLAAIASGVSAIAGGVVVAGSTSSARGGTLAGVRESSAADTLLTVDGVQRPLGRITALVALTVADEGQTGAYGPDGDGPVPLG
ncbi:copper transporter [Nocardioides bruguierae]|uniref:Copper transporter n=1 Tax=Nocardioides bruguierae TaxID=2945102 RepID=A0A9X2IHB4_9ACTN|nr:copper transporter [Nocardioides bruguierae]MCM0622434.1 copper transporter [Nocardioides bruguierae]